MSNRKLVLTVFLIVLAVCAVLGTFSTGATSDDPADNYVKEEAPNEDYDIDLWFDYSFRKNFTSDKNSTGMDTFSVYMAKNEIESAQFVLYSDDDKTGMKAELSQFTDGKGNTVATQIYYEMYVTTENLNLYDTVYGDVGKTNLIREGETPDPIAPLDSLGTFKLVGGKSQAFLIRCKTLSDTASGWYSARLNIKDSAGAVVKTAEVYLYVWDFEISEKTELRTAMFMEADNTYGGTYTDFYNYLLENRMCAMDLPSGRTSATSSYLTNDRVNAIRVSSTGNGATRGPYMDSFMNFKDYLNIYNSLAERDDFDEIKNKFYIYTADEPTCDEQVDATEITLGERPGWYTVSDVSTLHDYAAKMWPEPKTVVPLHTNSPYPPYAYHTNLSQYQDYELMDGIQAMMDADSVQIWCPNLYYFTPSYELNTVGLGHGILDENGEISELFSVPNPLSPNGYAYGAGYYNWRTHFGDFSDRVKSYIANKKGNGEDYELWTYRAGSNAMYTYCHHLIENTGLQTKLLFWQCYQEGITGYLYYDVNEWGSVVDKTPTGAKTNVNWRTNKYTYPNGYNIYGMGHLMYGVNQGYIRGVSVIGSLRTEILRDGIEEYQMLSMLSKLKGEDASQEIISNVSTNVVNYLSLKNFSTSGWSSSMDEYDIMEAVRRNLGNQVEAASVTEICEHDWNNGEIIKDPTCLEIGLKQYTCSLCNATRTENIPSLHEQGDVFVLVPELSRSATCTEQGRNVYRCTVCGYKRGVYVKAFHDDNKVLNYVSTGATIHRADCPVCGITVLSEGHILAVSKVNATCQAEGLAGKKCTVCGERFEDTVLEKTDHNYVNGFCTMCGEPEFIVIYGDLNGDGKVTATDINILARTIVGSVTLDEGQTLAADVSGDGKITATDTNYINRYLTGTIETFPADNK